MESAANEKNYAKGKNTKTQKRNLIKNTNNTIEVSQMLKRIRNVLCLLFTPLCVRAREFHIQG